MAAAKKTAKKKATKKKATKKTVKRIKRDPIKEYQEVIQKLGVVEIGALSGEEALCHPKAYVSTQSIALDRALGVPGVPTGRIVEIFGPEAAGKSTLLDHIFAQAQSVGGIAVLADAEHARDLEYTRRIGVDVDKLQWIGSRTETLEEILTAVEESIKFWTNKYPETPVVIGIDTIAALASKKELEGAIGDSHMGVTARLIRQALRRISSLLSQTKVVLICLNQEYKKLGVVFGNPNETYGGGGLKYYSTIRIRMTRKEAIKGSNGAVLGHAAEAYVVKNKLAAPHRKARLGLIPSIGIDNSWSLFDSLHAQKIITTHGSWYAVTLEGHEPVQWQGGYAGLLEKVKEDPKLFQNLVQVFMSL